MTLEHTRPVGPIEINQVTEWDETPTLASGVRQSCVWGSALAQQMLDCLSGGLPFEMGGGEGGEKMVIYNDDPKTMEKSKHTESN